MPFSAILSKHSSKTRPRQAEEEEDEEEDEDEEEADVEADEEEETEEAAPCVSMAVKSLSVARANPDGVMQQRLNSVSK